MFKHLLIPTDGSELALAAAEKCMQFAKSLQASVTGVHVMPHYHIMAFDAQVVVDTEAEFRATRRSRADEYLSILSRLAASAGVPFEPVAVSSDHPYEAIIKAAEDMRCDAIVMASHGRRGVKGLLLGGETHKVLTHCKIPVLVLR